jgi:hypothetical protein
MYQLIDIETARLSVCHIRSSILVPKLLNNEIKIETKLF